VVDTVAHVVLHNPASNVVEVTAVMFERCETLENVRHYLLLDLHIAT
jgi:hypothetical protein